MASSKNFDIKDDCPEVVILKGGDTCSSSDSEDEFLYDRGVKEPEPRPFKLPRLQRERIMEMRKCSSHNDNVQENTTSNDSYSHFPQNQLDSTVGREMYEAMFESDSLQNQTGEIFYK